MTTKHPLIEFVAGDDWEIRATLEDETGTPYNLTQPNEILWRLINQCGSAIADEDVQINYIDAPNGRVSVLIPASVSTKVNGGLYNDALRLTLSGQTGTLFMGPVNVVADPWRLADAVVAAQGNNIVELRRIVRQPNAA